MRVHITMKSANAKTGPIPVSTSSADTCPGSCPFKKQGCYADSGPLALHWAKVTAGDRGMPWSEFCDVIAALPADQLWRMNQAGDLPGIGESVDPVALGQLVAANAGRRGFTYTHKHSKDALHWVRHANDRGFTVNLSANDLQHADQLADTQAGPVVVVLPIDAPQQTITPAGRKVITCPATYREDVSCATCQLCQRQRDTIIGFPAHGTGKAKVEKVFFMKQGATA
jgi:hypothetical protein